MRPWRPISGQALREIIDDTERDYPNGVYSEEDVYRLAREVEASRRARPRPKKKARRA